MFSTWGQLRTIPNENCGKWKLLFSAFIICADHKNWITYKVVLLFFTSCISCMAFYIYRPSNRAMISKYGGWIFGDDPLMIETAKIQKVIKDKQFVSLSVIWQFQHFLSWFFGGTWCHLDTVVTSKTFDKISACFLDMLNVWIFEIRSRKFDKDFLQTRSRTTLKSSR